MGSDPTVLIIGAFGGMLAGFFAIVKYILGQSSVDRESDRTERQALTIAIEKMATSSDKIAIETARGNLEAKERNGHLGEQNIQITGLIVGQNTDINAIKIATEASVIANNKVANILSKSALIAAEDRDILTGGNQFVHEQTVEHQVVNSSVNEA